MWFLQSLEAMWAIVTLTAMTAPVSVPTWLWLRSRKRTRAAWSAAEAAALWEVDTTPVGADAIAGHSGVMVQLRRVARVGGETRTLGDPHKVTTVRTMLGYPISEPNVAFQDELDAAVEQAHRVADTLNNARYSV